MEGSKVLDLYAGVGLFSLPLAASGAKVTAAEVSKSSATDLATNLLPFGNAKTVQATTESFLARVTQPYDAIVVDPPRAGLGIEVPRQLVRIAAPRLAIAGLNPHAGEKGALGSEETTIVQPAIDILRAEGIDVSGPWPPDTMFTVAARARYDVAICMYHDQALIPLKTLDMDHGVNVTLGLPIVRTSPDHGTAFDIAGTGVADPTSLIAAIELAAKLAARRDAAIPAGQPGLATHLRL